MLSSLYHRNGNMTISVATVTTLAHSKLATKVLVLTALYYGRNPNIVSSFQLVSSRTGRPIQEDRTKSHRLRLLEGSVEVRDWRFGEESAIQSLLRQSSFTSASSSPSFFDPEGPLETDCGSREALLDSYSASWDDSDRGCFLVAEFTPGDDDEEEDYDTRISSRQTSQTRPPTVVGTAGLILGTKVQYLSSGSSYSTPAKVTGAIRRVCCTSPPSARSSSYLSMLSSTAADDQSMILKALLLEVEARARQKGATELILLAYPQHYTTPLMARPTPELVSELGFQPQGQLDVPTRGGDSIETIQQYYKVLKYYDTTYQTKRSTTVETTSTSASSRFNLPVGVIVAFVLSSILGLA